MPDPSNVVLAGDWHGDTHWAIGVIELLPQLLPAESPRIIVQLGDFGFAPHSRQLMKLSDALAAVDGQLWWIDGNHEYWNALNKPDWGDSTARRHCADRVWWLPRGHRWTWGGRSWCAVGGAVSVDRIHRTPFVDWWPDEEITPVQAEAIAAAGPVDVVLAHDCPAGVRLNMDNPAEFGWAIGDISRANMHRRLLADLAAKIKPSWWLHGHYHQVHRQNVDLGYGPVTVAGLDMNSVYFGNYAVVNTTAMELW